MGQYLRIVEEVVDLEYLIYEVCEHCDIPGYVALGPIGVEDHLPRREVGNTGEESKQPPFRFR